ncbi:hypothetical protein PGT21_017932 [Puccinia graminis f. sp. tritici]|uniref:Uncharacterized protein n=1 Tax=Puccinia graminis f. sp. tritici TaxID=56615 RepID=A0A5B0ML83_PUCGR|nr:hypothetical protein PGT21_017932 [Puccinia graminis f. sp. tritici]KAA1126929.1 hypothetical protein PGTUg99_032166 [Puccinia graminis f. sp. tritici]
MPEVTVLREELSNLRTRLENLEARLTTIPLAPVQISSWKLEKTQSFKYPKTSSSEMKRNSQTLRSRLFKVMRHLFNMFDVLQVKSTASLSRKNRNKDNSCNPTPSSPASKARVAANPKTTLTLPLKEKAVLPGNQNDSHASTISLPPITELGTPVNPMSLKKPPIPPKSLEKTLSTSSETPRRLHPRVPCSATALPATTEFRGPMKAQSAKEPVRLPCRLDTILYEGSDSPQNLHPKQPRRVKLPNDLSTADKGANCNNSQATANISTVTRTPENILPEVFAYNKLPPRCGQFLLLKHDPAMLDLIPTSVKDKRFIATASVTDIENLPQASKILIQSKILGIWEWKEGTSRARLHEYKTPELGTTKLQVCWFCMERCFSICFMDQGNCN